MKVYIAARARNRVAEVNKIQKALRELGHTITYDWAATNTSVKKPYRNSENREHNMQAVPKMLKAAAEAQVFILMTETGMRGAYVELGTF